MSFNIESELKMEWGLKQQKGLSILKCNLMLIFTINEGVFISSEIVGYTSFPFTSLELVHNPIALCYNKNIQKLPSFRTISDISRKGGCMLFDHASVVLDFEESFINKLTDKQRHC